MKHGGVFWLLALAATVGCGTPAPLRALPPPPDFAAAPPDAEATISGFASKVIASGSGRIHPGSNDRVTVHFTGWTADGRMFDSSVVRGAPKTVRVAQAIGGWRTGLQLMVVGETRRMWVPQWLGYEGVRPPKGALVFDLTLLAIN